MRAGRLVKVSRPSYTVAHSSFAGDGRVKHAYPREGARRAAYAPAAGITPPTGAAAFAAVSPFPPRRS